MEVESRQGRRSISVNNLNDVISLDSSTKNINVEAKGRGLALVNMVSTFSTTSKHIINKEFDVNAFNLEARVEFQTIKFNSEQEVKQILVLSCQRWNCQKDLSVSGQTWANPSIFEIFEIFIASKCIYFRFHQSLLM